MPTYRNDGSDIIVTHGESFVPGAEQIVGSYIENTDLTLVSDNPIVADPAWMKYFL